METNPIMKKPFDLSRLKNGKKYWAKILPSGEVNLYAFIDGYMYEISDDFHRYHGYIFYAIDTRPIEPSKELEEA